MASESCCKSGGQRPIEDVSLDLSSTRTPVQDALSSCSRFYPLLLTFSLVIGGAFITQFPIGESSFDTRAFMNNLMGLLLISFSYLKLLNPRGFRTAFSKYDILAFYVPVYGYVYPLVEYSLGVFYCLRLCGKRAGSLFPGGQSGTSDARFISEKAPGMCLYGLLRI